MHARLLKLNGVFRIIMNGKHFISVMSFEPHITSACIITFNHGMHLNREIQDE